MSEIKLTLLPPWGTHLRETHRRVRAGSRKALLTSLYQKSLKSFWLWSKKTHKRVKEVKSSYSPDCTKTIFRRLNLNKNWHWKAKQTSSVNAPLYRTNINSQKVRCKHQKCQTWLVIAEAIWAADCLQRSTIPRTYNSTVVEKHPRTPDATRAWMTYSIKGEARRIFSTTWIGRVWSLIGLVI